MIRGNLQRLALSLEEAREVVPVSRASFYRAIGRDELETFKCGRRRLVTPKALQDWVKKLEQQARSEK